MKEKQNYFRIRWQANKKKYHRIMVNLQKKDFERIAKLEEWSGEKKSVIARRAIESALHEEKLRMRSKEREEEQIKQMVRQISGIGTNINQIAHGVNTRRLANSVFGSELKKEEKARILGACEELEELILQLKKRDDH